MKCVRDLTTKRIMRVSDEYANDLVKHSGFKYCPKHEYKAQKRDRVCTYNKKAK